MNSIELEEIMSGEEADALWVTLGFSSELAKLDVIHVVVAKAIDEQDRELGMSTVYLERFDQAYSCYGGAESIRIGEGAIELVLSQQGQQALSLPAQVSFRVPKSCHQAYSEARHIFQKMQQYECGNEIELVA